jgi:hypothetical protein
MKKKAQKIVSLLLALAMTASTTCLAAATDETTLEPVYAQSGLMHHSYDNGAGINTISEATNLGFSEDARVNYDYQLTYYKTDPVNVGVQLNFDIISQGNDLSLTFNGDVERIEVSDELVVLRGPLYTTEEINGIEYEISAGFSKVESRDEISVGLVFSTNDNEIQDLYSFGTPVLSEAEYNTWKNAAISEPENATGSPQRAAEYGDFEYVDSDNGIMDVSEAVTTASGTGSYLYGFVDEENDRILAGVETTCYKLSEDSFTSGGYLAAGLYYMKVSFERSGAKGNILGFDYVNLPGSSGSSSSLNSLFVAFSALSNFLPSPYGTMASAFFTALSAGEYSASPRVTYSGANGSSTRSVWVALDRMNAVHEVNFDDQMCPIAISLGNSGSSAGNSNWTITLEAEYEVDLTYAAFYIPVSDAEVSIPVYFE